MAVTYVRKIITFGAIAGLALVTLQVIEYRWLVLDHSLEIYGGIIAALFAAMGIWLGLTLTRKTVEVREVLVPAPPTFVRDDAQVSALGLTPRELEILSLMAEGLSNREIAERAFVSENTVKTHAGRVLDKLGAARRTQAVQRARELRVVP
ncbi:MAG: response regulator transcription factor [Gemmatimonadaceae bacterium]|nr:response regulator transcription factor [Gemmatimonadaceae bacterium]